MTSPDPTGVEIPPKSRLCARGWHEERDLPSECTGYTTTDGPRGSSTTTACGCLCHSESLAAREAKLAASRGRVEARRAERRPA